MLQCAWEAAGIYNVDGDGRRGWGVGLGSNINVKSFSLIVKAEETS